MSLSLVSIFYIPGIQSRIWNVFECLNQSIDFIRSIALTERNVILFYLLEHGYIVRREVLQTIQVQKGMIP